MHKVTNHVNCLGINQSETNALEGQAKRTIKPDLALDYQCAKLENRTSFLLYTAVHIALAQPCSRRSSFSQMPTNTNMGPETARASCFIPPLQGLHLFILLTDKNPTRILIFHGGETVRMEKMRASVSSRLGPVN